MNLDKYQQSMENWKKEIIIDPRLNGLFDSQMTPQQFLKTKIMTLPQEDIIKIYMKLTSLHHALTKNMHKEIELRHSSVQGAFQDCLRSKSSYEDINQDQLRDHLKQIQRFNEKYELISDRVTEIKNINKILHFSKALQKFKVNVRLLKTMMQDFDQVASSRLQSELLNTLKISKIIKEISAITIKFDFSGIKSFEEERVFLNNTKGALFGLIERELTSALTRIPSLESNRRVELEKEIINKFMVLNNLMKLKDFCIPFYKNTLKEMSELLKKSLVIGQSVDERDPTAYLETFEEYFTNSLKRRLVENGTIFIALDELLAKSSIRTPFNFHFFTKYWENVTGFMKDLIAWSIDNDAKERSKDKLTENVFQSFNILESKGYISKYLTAIIWKYPIIYESLTSMSNDVHLHIIKHGDYYDYQFQTLKEQFLKVLVPLAQLYYRQAGQFYATWSSQIERKRASFDPEEKSMNFPLKRGVELFEEDKTSKTGESLSHSLQILEWLTFNIRTKEIFDFHSQQILVITDGYFKIFTETFSHFDAEKHSKDDFSYFIKKCEDLVLKIKSILRREKAGPRQGQEGQLEAQFSKLTPREGVLGSSCCRLMVLIQTFRGYQGWFSLAKGKLQ